MFYYTYILLSQKDNKRYIGYTSDLRRRIKEHNDGLNKSTKNRRPFKLVYYEACLSEKDAKSREKYLKGQWGCKFIDKRLKNFYKNL